MRVSLVVVGGGDVGLQASAGREAAQHALVRRPEPLGLHEGLVVEPGRQEAAHPLIRRLDVEAQRRPGVLRDHRHARLDPPLRAADVRLVVHLDETAGIEPRGRQDAARAMVLEAAREHADTRRGERRDDRIAGVSGDRVAVPGEGEALRAVDDLARLTGQAQGLPRGTRRRLGCLGGHTTSSRPAASDSPAFCSRGRSAAPGR